MTKIVTLRCRYFLSVGVFFIFCFCWWGAYSQNPDWVWGRGAKCTTSEGLSAATDSLENVYFAGVGFDSVKFGSNGFFGGEFTCIAKYDSSGNLKWAKGAGGPGTSYGGSVCTDALGNCYVANGFFGTISFGSTTLSSPGNANMFLIKLDFNGNVIWAKNVGGAGSESANNVTTDSKGNVYVIGDFTSPSFTVGSFTLTCAGSLDIFVIKYDSSGNVLWAKSAGGTSSDEGLSIASDAFGNVYITGYSYSSTMSFGSYTISMSGMIFVAKYDSLGNIKWAKSFGNSNSIGSCVTADVSGKVYLTGDYNGGVITFGALTLPYAGGEDAFLSKFDSSGNVIWAKNIGNTGNDKGNCIVTDKCANIYLSGGSWNPVSPSLTFDTITLQLSGGDPLFIAKFDSSGHALFAKSASSGGDDQNAIALTRSGNLYIGGDYSGSFIVGQDTLIGAGGEDFFVAKLDHVSHLNCTTLLTAIFQSTDTTFCTETGKCISFTDHSTGNPTTWQWLFPGAIPDSSNQQNPDSICYSSAGTYAVTLIVTNSAGSDTLTVSPMITVGSAPAPPVITVVGGDTLYCSHAAGYQWYFNGSPITGATDSFYVWHSGGTYSVQITDGNGCNSLSQGTTVGIDELSGGGGVEVYPNPANQSVVISWQSAVSGNIEITVLNVIGERVYSTHLAPGNRKQETVNCKQLAAGVYFVRLLDERGSYGAKFVKE